MTETELRNDIARRAPQMRILTIGALFGNEQLDAVVEDRRGQYLWSAWRRQTDPPAIAAAPEVSDAPEAREAADQLNLF